MTKQPRDENGHFVPFKTVNSEENKIVFYISEFECRVIGNRLHRASERLTEALSKLDVRIDQDCDYWSRRFLNKCSTRSEKDEEYYERGKKRHTESNYHVKVELTDYECWSLGNRLFEIGQYFEKKGDENVASETKWLARRFHAEQKENNDRN
jgi:hypothetical protein